MSTDPPHTSNDAEENLHRKIYVTSFSTVCIQEHCTLHYKTGKLPSFTLTFTGDMTAHCATRQTSTLNLAHTNTVVKNRLAYSMSPAQSKGTLLYAELKLATYKGQCIISTHYVVQCCEQVLPEFGIAVMEVAQVEILDFCIPLMHFMTENTFTITGVPDNCTVPNTQLKVQIGLWNHVITRHNPLCVVGHPDISILNGKHTNSVNTNNTHITFMPLKILSLNLLTAHGTSSSTRDHRNHGYNVINCSTIKCVHRSISSKEGSKGDSFLNVPLFNHNTSYRP
jgi:hypothetical protein